MAATGNFVLQKNGTTITDSVFLYPDDNIIVTYTLNNINQNNNYGIKILFNETAIYRMFEITPASQNITNATYNLKIPNIFTDSPNIQFLLIEQVTNNNITTDVIITSGSIYSNYVYPVIIEQKDIKINRCDNNYVLNPYGEYVIASKIKWQLLSGNINDITNIKIKINKSVADFVPIELSLLYDNYLAPLYNDNKISFFSEEGYTDTDKEVKLFTSLNNINIFKEIKFTYDFEFIFTYIDITGTSRTLSFSNIKLEQSLTSLQLIGRTKLENGNEIYGGVTIGQNPTINKIGEPAFECGYPAYFNNNLYINGQRYGYYPGDEFIITDVYYSVMGYITNNEKRLAFTFYLGQPIYANDFDIEGKVVRRSDNAYLTSNEYQNGWDMGANNNIAIKTITNRKAGIVTVAWEQAVGTAGSNNHPVVMNCHETSYIKITFK